MKVAFVPFWVDYLFCRPFEMNQLRALASGRNTSHWSGKLDLIG
jgi:hypothetical protein